MSSPPSPRTAAMAIQMRAMRDHFERLLREQGEQFQQKFDELERRSNDGSGDEEERRRRRRQGRDPLRGIKIKVQSFVGKSDPEAYLEWETKIEQIFNCHNYSDVEKVQVASIEFKEYALVWWDQLIKDRRRYDERPIDTWEEMKRIMRRRFVPSYYHRDLHNKLQRLTQGSKSVEEYFKEMEVAKIRANVEEDNEATMARFLHGLNRDISDIVELHHYVEMDELVHQAIKVEQQLKRKSQARRSSTNFNSPNLKDKEGASSSSSTEPIVENKGKAIAPSQSVSTNKKVTCFKCQGKGHIASECPTKRTMLMEENEEEEEGNKDVEENDEEEIPSGELLMVRRMLWNLVKEEDTTQRENLFHTRCLVQKKVCSLIIDGGSCTNVASTRLVSKLNLETKPHPKPYKLQWLNESVEMVVNRQVEVCFTIGKYEDVVLCDVVPMEASHLLLGRPWQFDKKVSHEGYSNKYSFVHHGQKIVLVSLSPNEVREDQKKMREKNEQEKEKNEKDKEKKKSDKRNNDEMKENLIAKKGEVGNAIVSKQHLYLLFCKNVELLANTPNPQKFPSCVETHLQEFEDMFPKEVPSDLPPIIGIEHHNDLNLRPSMSTRPTYRINQPQTKESQKQVAEFVRKLHEQVKMKNGEKIEIYAKKANKGWMVVVFDPGNWIRVQMKKELLKSQKKSKLKGEELFNSRSNSLQEGGNDEDIIQDISDAIQSLGGPMKRACARRINDVLVHFMIKSIEGPAQVDEGLAQIEEKEPKLKIIIQAWIVENKELLH
ncbi:unnamed protein product [Trifolium pratense]|uniref:Uncharacterized protein n=1 Tax=Trifolium pratense TaxID=57577 RepID=A0ACB0JPS4_TRIPR|nr:unnamed protein product [Trifolium pratense]